MENIRKLMQFYFLTESGTSDHYHQNPELFYILRGTLEVKIDDKVYELRQEDIVLINANKRHTMTGKEGILAARFEIDFHLLAEYMGTMQLLFWCNTIVDKNAAYDELRKVLDQILARYFERDEKGAFDLNALYFQAAHILTSNFLINMDDSRFENWDSQNRIRIKNIQNYIQANYQSQISLNDLAQRLYLSNAYLSKYIKKNLGMTFIEYLNNVRLFHAVDEILYTEKNITHIALDNGFPTSAAFTKAFRESYHEAPSEYRRKMQKIEQEEHDEKELNEKNRDRIISYLRIREKGEIPEVSSEELCDVYADKSEKHTSCTYRACNIGDVYSILQSDVQEQIKLIKKRTGMQYIRIWNILSKEYCFDENDRYNFRKLDQVLDFLLENDMRPYMELGNKPSLFMYTPERSVKQEKTEKAEQYKYEIFCKIIRELCIHLVNRYGEEEIEKWYFEFWNDPFLNICEEDGAYYQYFDVIYTNLKAISNNIKVGGAGIILGYETCICNKIFGIWKNRDIHPDFLSFCSYQYIAVIENGQRYGRKSIDENYMSNQIEIMKEVIKESGLNVPELHIDEWNFTVSNRNVINDSCEQAAYIIKNCMDVSDRVNLMAYWHALDTYSYYYDTDCVLNGDSGLITGDGICKPSFFAFWFLNRIQSNLLKKTAHAMVTGNGRNNYTIVCHNYKKLTSRYVFSEENEIEIENINQYTDDEDSLNLKFCFHNIKNGKYQIKQYYVNRKNGSVQDLWRQLGYSRELENSEIDYLKSVSMPGMKMETVQVKNGILTLENIIMPQEIRMIEILYRYSYPE